MYTKQRTLQTTSFVADLDLSNLPLEEFKKSSHHHHPKDIITKLVDDAILLTKEDPSVLKKSAIISNELTEIKWHPDLLLLFPLVMCESQFPILARRIDTFLGRLPDTVCRSKLVSALFGIYRIIRSKNPFCRAAYLFYRYTMVFGYLLGDIDEPRPTRQISWMLKPYGTVPESRIFYRRIRQWSNEKQWAAVRALELYDIQTERYYPPPPCRVSEPGEVANTFIQDLRRKFWFTHRKKKAKELYRRMLFVLSET